MTTSQISSALVEASKRKLNLSSLTVLLHCAEHEGVTFTQMAKMIGRTPACVSAIADQLHERDLVRRRSVIGGDRRTWTLALTDKGFGLLSAILNLPKQTTTPTTIA